MAKLPPSRADRSSDMIPGLAHTCPQVCPALSGGWPAEPWTRQRTPRSTWTKSSASTPSTTCGTPPSADERPNPLTFEPGVPGHRATGTTLRWIMHMIEETARHAGHMDAIRELLDGRKGYY